MIILGNKYKFTDLEKQRLSKKKHILHDVTYLEKEPQSVLNEIQDLISTNKATIIVLNTKAKVDDKIIKYLTSLQFNKHVKIMIIEKFLEDYLHKCYIPEDHTDLKYLVNIKPYSSFQYIQKRIIDYVGVFTLLFLTWPILLFVRYKIKKESPGTSMFKQDRVGLENKTFKCLKFRSMHINSHHDKYTRENDTRIFKCGQTIRKTRIDELPQLLNVFKGDMHFIGPRAEWDILVKEYETQIPYYHERHLVRPGITGWAQVNYPYGANIEDTKQKLMYDLYYIKYWSIFLEIKVIWKTVMVVLGKQGI